MRHPFISFTAWTTVVTVVLSALWLAMIEEQIRPKGDRAPRSIGLRVAEPHRDGRAQGQHPSAPAVAASTEPTNLPATLRAQMLAWTR